MQGIQLSFLVDNESYYSSCFRGNIAPRRNYELKMSTSIYDFETPRSLIACTVGEMKNLLFKKHFINSLMQNSLLKSRKQSAFWKRMEKYVTFKVLLQIKQGFSETPQPFSNRNHRNQFSFSFNLQLLEIVFCIFYLEIIGLCYNKILVRFILTTFIIRAMSTRVNNSVCSTNQRILVNFVTFAFLFTVTRRAYTFQPEQQTLNEPI